MVSVEFMGPIARESITLEALNLSEVATLLKKDPDIASWLDKCAIAINDKMVSGNVWLNDGDRITLLPPVCGG